MVGPTPYKMLVQLLMLSLACVAWGTAQDPGMMVTPVFEEPRQSNQIFVKQAAKAVLKCKASGNPEPVYKWTWNEKPLTNSPQRSFDSQTGDLTFEAYSFVFDGDYMCLATVGDATSMSQIQTVQQTQLNAFINDSAVTEKEVDEYAYTKFDCLYKGVVIGKDIVFSWFQKKNDQLKENERLFFDLEGNMHLVYTLRSDQKINDERYRCGYTNEKGSSIQLGHSNYLKVNQQSEPKSRQPILKYFSKGVQADLGTTARLQCVFAGYDLRATNKIPSIKWLDRNHKEIRNGTKFNILKYGRELVVKSLVETDDGRYFCKGVTSSGESPEIEVFLNVTSPPLWNRDPGPPKSQIKAEGETAVFHCNARSLSQERPPNPPIWYFNGKLVDDSSRRDPSRYIFSNDKKTLTITDLKKSEDILCLQCKVSNNRGVLLGDVCLTVINPIVITKRPEPVQEISKGDIIRLTVEAEVDETISLEKKWIFNDEEYLSGDLPPFVEKDPVLNTLYINTSLLTNEEYEKTNGVYTCRVSHLYQTVDVKTEVKLQDDFIVNPPTPAPAAASAGFDVWIIGLILGIIFLIIVIAIIIFVVCRKQQEGDYNVDKKETGAGLDPEKELRDKGFNDLSRPDYDDYDYPEKNPRGELEYDNVPIGDDDESLGEYGDEEDTHFNEDGSFIGIYQKKENERQNHKAESTI